MIFNRQRSFFCPLCHLYYDEIMMAEIEAHNISSSNYLTPSTRTIFRALLDDTVDDIHLLVTLPACCPIDDPFIEKRILEGVGVQFVEFYGRTLSVYHLYVIVAEGTYLKKLMINPSISCRSQKTN